MRRAGFTLIEVIVAIAIFMFGVTAILGLFQVGGNLEQDARVQAELAPAIEPLVDRIRAEAWRTDPAGKVLGLQEFQGETVPGAPDYRFDLVVRPEGEQPLLRHAELRFYRKSPDRILTRVPFLLERDVPITRVLEETKP